MIPWAEAFGKGHAQRPPVAEILWHPQLGRNPRNVSKTRFSPIHFASKPWQTHGFGSMKKMDSGLATRMTQAVRSSPADQFHPDDFIPDRSEIKSAPPADRHPSDPRPERPISSRFHSYRAPRKTADHLGSTRKNLNHAEVGRSRKHTASCLK